MPISISQDSYRWWTLAALSLALFMSMFEMTVVVVALPALHDDLDASVTGLQWAVNAYTLTFAALIVTAGRLGDIYGRRLMFMIGVVVFAGASAGCGLSPSLEVLLAWRGVQGAGAACMMPATLSIIASVFAPSERGRAIGIWTGVSALAVALGPPIGGVLTHYASWRAVFFVNLPIAAAAALLALRTTPESRDPQAEHHLDVAGIVTLTLGLLGALLALVEGGRWGWTSPATVMVATVGLTSLVGFLVIERTSAAPLVALDLFRSRIFLGASVVAFATSFALIGTLLFIALYLQNVLGFEPLEAGLRFLPATLLLIVFSPLAGRVGDRIGHSPIILAGLVLCIVSLTLQTRIGIDTGYALILPALALMGAGIGISQAPTSAAAMNAVDPGRAGLASGSLALSRLVGRTFGVAAVGALFHSTASADLRDRLSTLNLGPKADAIVSESADVGQPGPTALGLNEDLRAEVVDAIRVSFVDALTSGLTLALAITVAGTLLAYLLLISRGPFPPRREATSPCPPQAATTDHHGELPSEHSNTQRCR